MRAGILSIARPLVEIVRRLNHEREMSNKLRSRVIRLAHEKPELRSELLPILTRTAAPTVRTFKWEEDAEDWVREWFLARAEATGIPAPRRLRKKKWITDRDDPRGIKLIEDISGPLRRNEEGYILDMVYRMSWRKWTAYLVEDAHGRVTVVTSS